MAEPESPETLQVPIAWVGVEDLTASFVNQFLFQVVGEEIVLTFGQMTPPPLLGTPEEQAEQARQIAVVPVKPVTRIALNRQRVEEMIGLLQQTLENQDKQRELLKGGQG